MPSNWGNTAAAGDVPSGYGHATYVIDILLPTDTPPLSLRLETVSTAYSLYANNQLVTQVGQVGTSVETSKPGYEPQVAPLPQAEGRLRLVMPISNYTHARGGLRDTVSIGLTETLNESRELRLGGMILVLSACMLIGLYHLMLWMLQRRDYTALIFSVLSPMVVLRILTIDDVFLATLYEGIPYIWLVRLEYLSMNGLFVVTWLFYRFLFPHEVPWRIALFFIVPCVIYMVLIALLPVHAFTTLVWVFKALAAISIVVAPILMVKAVRHRRDVAVPFMISVFLLCGVVLYDILSTVFEFLPPFEFLGDGLSMVPMGYFGIILTQAAVLARRSALSTAQIQAQSEELRVAHARLEKHAEDLELAVEERTAELQEANHQLSELSRMDSLTGLANRRSFEEALQLFWTDHVRRKSSLAVVLIDIDNFKAFNDHYGHTAGDAALRLVAQALADTPQRPRDMIARFGGEEVIVLLADTDVRGASQLADAMREAVETLAKPHVKSEFGIITVSGGVAASIPGAGTDPIELVNQADKALYQAKANGRNRIEG